MLCRVVIDVRFLCRFELRGVVFFLFRSVLRFCVVLCCVLCLICCCVVVCGVVWCCVVLYCVVLFYFV